MDDPETPVINLSEFFRVDREGVAPVAVALTLPRYLVEDLSALAERLPQERNRDPLSAAARLMLLAGRRVLSDAGEAAGFDFFERTSGRAGQRGPF